MFVVYAQRVESLSLVTFNQFANTDAWRKEMVSDGFTVQRGINVFVDPIAGNKVIILAECATETEASDYAKFGNRVIAFNNTD